MNVLPNITDLYKFDPFKVLATGYDMYHYKDQPIRAHGKTFDDFWSDTAPFAWSGVLHPNFPNYFMMLGKYSKNSWVIL